MLGFNDTAPDGSVSQGIVLETAPEAQVVAPHDGQVVFRGPFRGYGEILIIEHRGGYHTLLAGLGRTDAVVGQWLLTGEPVGNMESPRVGKPRLYIELRRGGRPINPWPWFEARISKVE
jgi:septal ring factor EnvC (AmiA/AmiB activator)